MLPSQQSLLLTNLDKIVEEYSLPSQGHLKLQSHASRGGFAHPLISTAVGPESRKSVTLNVRLLKLIQRSCRFHRQLH
jgi:hypothetical protein